MRRANSLISGEIFLDGISNVLAEPEFTDSEDARKTLEFLKKEQFFMNYSQERL